MRKENETKSDAGNATAILKPLKSSNNTFSRRTRLKVLSLPSARRDLHLRFLVLPSLQKRQQKIVLASRDREVGSELSAGDS